MGLMAVYGQTLKGGSVGVDTLCINFQLEAKDKFQSLGE